MIFFILFLAQISNGQNLERAQDYPKSRHFMLVLEAQHLRSTHSQTIYAGSVLLGYAINPSFSVGIGCEFSHTDSLFTHDRFNTVLEFTPLPLYAETRYVFIRHSKVMPYLNLAMGISSITYDRKRFDATAARIESKSVHQNGFFLKAGVGLLFNTNHSISPLVNASFEGFHVSRNPNEINPHGAAIQVGLMLRNR